uniref:hypothetical protein n=1 Tax=Varibaculum cambriense TaxID=184870 RepID=UPI00242E00E3
MTVSHKIFRTLTCLTAGASLALAALPAYAEDSLPSPLAQQEASTGNTENTNSQQNDSAVSGTLGSTPSTTDSAPSEESQAPSAPASANRSPQVSRSDVSRLGGKD